MLKIWTNFKNFENNFKLFENNFQILKIMLKFEK